MGGLKYSGHGYTKKNSQSEAQAANKEQNKIKNRKKGELGGSRSLDCPVIGRLQRQQSRTQLMSRSLGQSQSPHVFICHRRHGDSVPGRDERSGSFFILSSI